MDCWRIRPTAISINNWRLLRRIYHHPTHIDLFTGGLAETPAHGGLLGPLNTKLMGWQFEFLKYGDRFFFTHRGQFNGREYREIMKRTLGDVICDNTQISKVPRNVFLLNRGYKNCPKYSQMDIAKFDVKRVPH